jgi:hypothetical protein
MGGNALKNTTTRRLDKSDFDRVSAAITTRLKLKFPLARVDVIPAYASKSDFGDLDILVTAEGLSASGGRDALRSLATNEFFSTDMYPNGNVLSFDYRASPDQSEPGFQVDVISMPEDAYDYALHYSSFNDLGNLIGRTAHKAGLTHGHDGLWYYLREGTYLFRSILLTRDYDIALPFLGYSAERFHQGFQNLTEIFEYVSGSEFFNSKIFDLENRNAAARVRDKKRKTYSEFLKYVEARPDLPKYPYPEDKKEWLPRIAQHFPHFQGEYDEAIRELGIQRAVKSKYNGEYVGTLTGLAGKELGLLMKRFKESFDSLETMNAYVLETEKSALERRIVELAKL